MPAHEMEKEIGSMKKHYHSCATQYKQLHHHAVLVAALKPQQMISLSSDI